jgi:hypothetical protein
MDGVEPMTRRRRRHTAAHGDDLVRLAAARWDLAGGGSPAESDETAEDAVYSVRATDDLVAGLGLDRTQPWLDRVPVRQDPNQGAWAPVCTAHTVVPYAVVAGHDLTWRDVEFGQVATPSALVTVQDAWITTKAATAWDVEALAVRNGRPINIVWVRLEITFGTHAPLPGGLELKLPPDRVVFASPIPEQVRDHRVHSRALPDELVCAAAAPARRHRQPAVISAMGGTAGGLGKTAPAARVRGSLPHTALISAVTWGTARPPPGAAGDVKW